MTKTRYENIAYDLLEDPEYYHDIYRIQALKSLSYADAQAVMKTLEDKEFLGRAEKFYQGWKYPSRRQRTALENIKERKDPLSHVRRSPQHFIDRGIVYTNGHFVEGMPFKFDTYGATWLQWQGRLGMDIAKVRVRGVELKDIAIRSFVPTEAFFSPRVVTNRDLPFAGAQAERRVGRVWWMATFDDGAITLEVKGIIGLTQRQLEDAFNNSVARVESRPLGYGRLPAKEGQMKEPWTREELALQAVEYPFLLDLDADGYEYPPDVRPPTWKVIAQKVYPMSEAEARKILEIIGSRDFLDKARRWGVKAKAPTQFWRNIKEIEDLVKKGKWPPGPRPGTRVPLVGGRCSFCGGELVPIGRLGRREYFRCRSCGLEVSREIKGKGRAPQITHPYAAPARKVMNELENLWKAGDTKEFYRVFGNVKDAIKERERGKIKKLPEISLGELRDIVKEADQLYR